MCQSKECTVQQRAASRVQTEVCSEMVYYKQFLKFKEWLHQMPSMGNSVLSKDYPESVYVYERFLLYLKFKNLPLHGFL